MEPSSVVDLTRDEDDLVPSQNNEVPEINCPERPGTPNLKCSICLEDITNKCNTDSCTHTFCFECLKRWSDEQPFCPLCKNIFKNIHHSFTSHGLHETYNVPSQEVVDRERTLFIRRSRVYNENLWAQPLPDINGRCRDFSSAFFSDNPYERNRLRNFILRDLLAIRILGSREFLNESTIISTIMQIISILEIRHALMSDVSPHLGMYTEHFCHEMFNYAYSPYDLTDYDDRVNYVRREELSTEIIRAGFNIPVPEDLRIQGETFILDNEHINIVTSQFQPGNIELSCDSSDMEIVNPPFEPSVVVNPPVVNPPVVNPPVVNPPVETFDFEPSTSTGIRNSIYQPNNRYNLRRGRLFPSTSNGSCSYPTNLSNKRSPTQLRRGNNMNSSSSDEEYMTSSDESITSSGEEFIPSAHGSQCPHLDKPAAFKRKKKTTKKNKYKKQKKD